VLLSIIVVGKSQVRKKRKERKKRAGAHEFIHATFHLSTFFSSHCISISANKEKKSGRS
jgi:hypothetical protein